jgi:hypothetical protein
LEEALLWGWVVVEIGKDVGRVAAPLAVCRRYVPHALVVLAACVVSWVLSEWEVEGAFKPLPRFIRDLIVWEWFTTR